MDALIVLHPDGLRYNGKDSYEDVVKKVRAFVTDLAKIIRPQNQALPFGNDSVRFSHGVFTVHVFEDKTLFDIASNAFIGEEADLFYSFFDEQGYTEELPFDALQDLSKYRKEEKICTAVAVLNSVPQTFSDEKERRAKENEKKRNYITFEKYEIVYDQRSWQFFRRQILGNHPGNAKEFVSQCRRLFDRLQFSEDCESSVSGYLDKIPRRLVYYLSCMNDSLKDHYCSEYTETNGRMNLNSFLANFSGEYAFDENGSMEMDTPNKEDYTFRFAASDRENTDARICCDAHMKIQHYDSNCTLQEAVRGEKCHGRIYFHFGDSGNASDRIKIGSMGKHI